LELVSLGISLHKL